MKLFSKPFHNNSSLATAIICFIIPLIFNAMNMQAYISLFVSTPLSQILAYLAVALILFGAIKCFHKIGPLSKTGRLWFLYFMFYYCFAFTADALLGNESFILRTLVAVAYFFGAYIFLSIEVNRTLFIKTLTILFFLHCVILVFFFKINFDIDHGGIYIYKLDRAGGLFADANNASLICILSYVMIKREFIPKTLFLKTLKIIAILIIIYSLFLTFSTTGFAAFILVFILSNHKYVTKKRILYVFGFGIFVLIILLNLKTITKSMNLIGQQQHKIDNIVNLITLNTKKVDNSGRGELLEGLFESIEENPFTGNGVDYAGSIYGHNTYVGVWADAGFFTFTVFVLMLVIYFKRTLNTPIDTRFYCLSLLIPMCIFMLSLQTIINQGYLASLFIYIAYLIDRNQKINS